MVDPSDATCHANAAAAVDQLVGGLCAPTPSNAPAHKHTRIRNMDEELDDLRPHTRRIRLRGPRMASLGISARQGLNSIQGPRRRLPVESLSAKSRGLRAPPHSFVVPQLPDHWTECASSSTTVRDIRRGNTIDGAGAARSAGSPPDATTARAAPCYRPRSAAGSRLSRPASAPERPRSAAPVAAIQAAR